MLGLVHTEHSSMHQRYENVWKNFAATRKADYEREDGITGYSWIARYTLQFLNAYLRKDAAAMAYSKRLPPKMALPGTL